MIRIFILIFFASCYSLKKSKNDTKICESKIKFDLNILDSQGLAGSKDAKKSIDYEFCIQNNALIIQKVLSIDPSCKVTKNNGRSKCSSNEVLVMGNTHQPHATQILYQLCSLDEIVSINETFWE